MTISGFTMVKNAGKFYYQLKESILSILPLVDEYVIAVGDNDPEDNTIEIIESIKSDKIKIVRTVWDTKKYGKGTILAQQTDEAKKYCKGDWLFYLQADEVVSEKDHDIIRNRCKELLFDEEVEGLLFRYIHFWGDYSHAFVNHHSWYRNEIRIIRNKPEIHSWRDAQSFRFIPNFTKEKYLQVDETRKLNVVHSGAHIYHYGWVRPPVLMNRKQTNFGTFYHLNQNYDEKEIISQIDFGPIGNVPVFRGSHPKVMTELINKFDWASQLNYSKKRKVKRNPYAHEKFKNRFLTIIENIFFKNGLFTFKNYRLLKK